MSPLVHLDFGHGGSDTGVVSGDLIERDYVTLVGLRLRHALVQACGISVSLARRAVDEDPSFAERAARAHQAGACLAVALHVNGIHDPTVRGAEVYAIKARPADVHTARQFLPHYPRELCAGKQPRLRQAAVTGPSTRWYQRAINCLQAYDCPAVLIEMGYATNDYDRGLLLNAKTHARIVLGLAQAIVEVVK